MRDIVFRGTPVRRLSAAMAILAIVGCGGAGHGAPTDAPAGAIAIAVAPVTLTGQTGISGVVGFVAITLTRAGTFAGDVTVSAADLPLGMTAATISIPAGTTTGTMIVTTPGATVGGALTLRATGDGVSDATVTVPVSLIPVGFTLAVSSPAVTVVAKSAGVSVTITGNWTSLPTSCPISLSSWIHSIGVIPSVSSFILTAAANTAIVTLSLPGHPFGNTSTVMAITGKVINCGPSGLFMTNAVQLTVTTADSTGA